MYGPHMTHNSMPKIINRLEVLLVKYKDKGFTNACSFLQSLSRRSKQTAFAYYYALGHLNKFIEESETYGNGNGNEQYSNHFKTSRKR